MRIILLLFLLKTTLSFSGEFLQLSDTVYQVSDPSVFSHLEFYKDSTNHISIDQLKNKKFDSIKYFGRDNFDKASTYWFRLKISNNSKLYRLWLFEILDPHVEVINVFQILGNDTIAFKTTGFKKEFSIRPFNHKNFVFPIRFYNSDSTIIYCSLKNNYYSISLSLRPAEQFIDYALNEYYLLGLFYGIILIMAIYNFFIFVSTKESVYLYYVAYVLCYCINSFEEDGMGFQYVWSEFPFINELFKVISSLLLIISFVFYSKKFLDLKSYSNRLNTFLNISLLFYCTLFLINYFIYDISWGGYFYILPFGLIFLGGIVAWRRGSQAAKYFLMAFSFLAFCFSVFFFRVMDIIPTNVYTVYALNFGFLMEVVLFSYALGQRLKIEKDEKAKMDELLILQLRENEKLKDSINKQLETKVEERTKQLNEKNQQLDQALIELKVKNSQIEALNKLLLKDNKALNDDIRDITQARLMLKDLTFDEFKKIYPDENACLKYLSEIKWSKNYSCKKCGNTISSTGKTSFSKRCTKCGYDESATAYTIFHNSKLPITKTFYLIHLILAHKDISSHELSEKLDLRQKTCWAFKKKIMETIEKNGKGKKITSKEWGYIFYIQS